MARCNTGNPYNACIKRQNPVITFIIRIVERPLAIGFPRNIMSRASYSHVEKQHADASEEEGDASEDDAEEDCQYWDNQSKRTRWRG